MLLLYFLLTSMTEHTGNLFHGVLTVEGGHMGHMVRCSTYGTEVKSLEKEALSTPNIS